MYKLMCKEINAILVAQTILIWTYAFHLQMIKHCMFSRFSVQIGNFKMKQHNTEKVLSGREKTDTSNDHDMLYIILMILMSSPWRIYCYTILGRREEIIKP